MRFDVLLQTLANQERLRTLVEQTVHLSEQELLDSLIKEFEQVCERYKSLSDFAEVAASRPLRIDPISISTPEIEFRFTSQPQPSVGAEYNREELRRQLGDVQRLIAEEVQKDWDTRAGEIRDRITRLKTSQLLLQDKLSAIEQVEISPDDEASAPRGAANAIPELDIREDDRVYLFGVGLSPDTGDSVFSHGEKGIDEDIVECWHAGVRVLLSIVAPDRYAMTTTGTLLLGKEESFRLRSAHEALLNSLRAKDHLLPFSWGTLVNGKSELFEQIERQSGRWKKRLQKESFTPSMDLRAYTSDEAVGKTIGHKEGRKLSVKLLEKILKHERALAEIVHNTLQPIARVSSLRSIISESGVSSDTWKLILESSYELAEDRRSEFFLALTRLQQEHNHGQLMLEVIEVGGRLTLADTIYDASA